MAEPVSGIDFANLPAPNEGILVAFFITVRKVARSPHPRMITKLELNERLARIHL